MAGTKVPQAVKDLARVLLLAGEAVPGWSVTVGTGYHSGSECWEHDQPDVMHVLLQRVPQEGEPPLVKVALNLTEAGTDSWARRTAVSGVNVEGHTCYDNRCFTRRGVDCSSCEIVPAEHVGAHAYADVAALLAGELQRCVAAAARSATTVPVPGLPFRVQPEWFAASAASLKAGRAVQLAPGGFGTGYTITRNRTGRLARYGEQAASPELEEKLGVGPLKVATFDHD